MLAIRGAVGIRSARKRRGHSDGLDWIIGAAVSFETKRSSPGSETIILAMALAIGEVESDAGLAAKMDLEREAASEPGTEPVDSVGESDSLEEGVGMDSENLIPA